MTSLFFILYLFSSAWWGYMVWLKILLIAGCVSGWSGHSNSKEFLGRLKFLVIEIVKLALAIILFLTQICFFYSYFANYCSKALPTLVV